MGIPIDESERGIHLSHFFIKNAGINLIWWPKGKLRVMLG